MNQLLRSSFLLTLVAALLLASGCASVNDSVRATPSQGTGFVPMAEMSQRDDLPFQKVWVKADVDLSVYKAIYIAPVNTKYLVEADWWQQNLRADHMTQDVEAVAQYTCDKFKEAFRCDPKKRFLVVDTPEPGSLTLELALTELVPSNVVMEALALAAPYGSGIVVKGVERQTGGVATVAFEARLNDTETGTTLGMCADRQHPKVNPIDLRGLTWYGEAHSIIDEWSQQFVQVANKRPGEVVKPASPFSLKPW